MTRRNIFNTNIYRFRNFYQLRNNFDKIKEEYEKNYQLGFVTSTKMTEKIL